MIVLACACANDRPAPAGSADEIEAPAATCDSAPDRDDRTICLPERVGPLTPSTSRTELGTLFPEAELRDEVVDAGEGMLAPGTIVNPGRGDEVTVLWTDSSRSSIAALQALGPAWRTPEDLGVGSTLDQIEAVLGTVDVLGFGWDYGGTILLDGTPWADRGLFLRTEPADSSERGSAAWQRVRGDRPFRSDAPDVEALDLVVRRVDVRFP